MDATSDYHLYTIFVKAYELKNYTRVAEAVGLSAQHIVSSKMKTLENKLGMKLFVRSFRGVETTSDATVLYNRVKPLLIELGSVMDSLRRFDESSESVIRIASTTNFATLYLMEFMDEFKRKYPKVQFDIRRVTSNVASDLLRECEVDLVVDLFDGEIDANKITLKRMKTTFIASESLARKFNIVGVVSQEQFAEMPYAALRGFAEHKKPDYKLDASHEMTLQFVQNNMAVSHCLEDFLALQNTNVPVVKFQVEGIDPIVFDLNCVYLENCLSNAANAFLQTLTSLDPS